MAFEEKGSVIVEVNYVINAKRRSISISIKKTYFLNAAPSDPRLTAHLLVAKRSGSKLAFHQHQKPGPSLP